MHESQCYITVKDHKEDFPNKISCRLLNPSQSDIGKISKIIIDKNNKSLVESTQVYLSMEKYTICHWLVC